MASIFGWPWAALGQTSPPMSICILNLLAHDLRSRQEPTPTPFQPGGLCSLHEVRQPSIQIFFSPSAELVKRGNWRRCSFTCWSACSASSVHSNFAFFFIVEKKWWHLSPDSDRKCHRAAKHPVRRWTSLTLDGDVMFKISWILSGFASIPLWSTRKPKNLPATTPNTHLWGFNFSLNFLSVRKVSQRSSVIALFLRTFI